MASAGLCRHLYTYSECTYSNTHINTNIFKGGQERKKRKVLFELKLERVSHKDPEGTAFLWQVTRTAKALSQGGATNSVVNRSGSGEALRGSGGKRHRCSCGHFNSSWNNIGTLDGWELEGGSAVG